MNTIFGWFTSLLITHALDEDCSPKNASSVCMPRFGFDGRFSIEWSKLEPHQGEFDQARQVLTRDVGYGVGS